MRRTLLITLAVASISASTGMDFAQESTVAARSVASRLDQVTVFEDRARVDRTVTTAVQTGENRIVIPGLPISLDPSSIWVDASGSVRVLGVRLDRAVHEEDTRTRVAALENEWREHFRRDRELAAREETEVKKRDLAREFALYLRQAMLERSTRTDAGETESLIEAEEWVSTRTIEAENAIAIVQTDREEVRRRQREIEQDLGRQRAGAGRVTYTAVVQVEAAGDEEATLRVGYDVAQARWTPVYEARLSEETGKVNWSYGAEIEQKSGEDWSGVELVLSTQRSSLGFAPPVLVPIQLGGYSVDKRNAGLVSEEVAASDATPARGQGGAAGADLSVAQIEGAGTVARFRVPVRAEIPADGRPHRVPILESELPVDLAFECVPRLAPHTYRRGKLENRTEAPFLPGVVRVFREGAFVGKTEIESVPPGASFRLSFGVEGRIVARRTELTDRERIVGSFKKGQRRTIGHEFTVRSSLPERCTLVLLDQIPISEIEGVTVKPTKACAPAPQVDPDGICRWNIDLAPGAERKVIFEIEVNVAKGVEFPIESVR